MKYTLMSRAQLENEQAALIAQMEALKAENLNLDMSRGKPCKEQLDMGLGMMEALGVNTAPAAVREPLPVAIGEKACSIREALFRPHETVPAAEGLGRICASPTVACPPAIPIAVSGEVIGEQAMALFRHYGVETLDVLL